MAISDDNRYLPRRNWAFRDLRFQLWASAKKPFIGVTQGGSSRKFAGCKPAATTGLFKPLPAKKEEFK